MLVKIKKPIILLLALLIMLGGMANVYGEGEDEPKAEEDQETLDMDDTDTNYPKDQSEDSGSYGSDGFVGIAESIFSPTVNPGAKSVGTGYFYWTQEGHVLDFDIVEESGEARVSFASHFYVSDGGEDKAVYCLDGRTFAALGDKDKYNATDVFSQDMVNKLAIGIHYIENNSMPSLSTKGWIQFWIYECLRGIEFNDWPYFKVLGISETSAKVELTKIQNYVNENTNKLKGYGYVYMKSGTQASGYFWAEEVPPGYGKIIKKSTNKSMTDGNSEYTMVGIKYDIYSDKSLTKKEGTLTLNSYDKEKSEGTSDTITLDVGTYYAVEVTGNTGSSGSGNSGSLGNDNLLNGYIPDRAPIEFKINSKETTEIEAKDDISYARLNLSINKLDSETGLGLPQGAASLTGAEFTIKYYDNIDAKGQALRTWIFKTDSKGVVKFDKAHFVSGDDFYYDLNGNIAFPIGTLTVQETMAPEGYEIDGKIEVIHLNETKDYKVKTDASTGKYNDKTGVEDVIISFNDKIFRGDFNLYKVDIDGTRMSGVPFLISRLDSAGNKVESHVIISDENGVIDTSLRPKTDDKVNSLDFYVNNGVYTGPVDWNAGIWFGEESAKSNSRGSLIYGEYIIEELMGEINQGDDLLSQRLFIGNIKENFIKNKKFDLKNIFVDLMVRMESYLYDDATESKMLSISDSAVVTDTVKWDHLKVGETYLLKTVITYESKTGEKKEIGENTVTIIPEKVDNTNTSYGITENKIKLNTSSLNGGMVHATDYIYAVTDNGEVLIGTHNKNLDVKSQMLGIPYMGTKAKDLMTGNNYGGAGKEGAILSVIDTVSYENFPADRTFILEGILRYADSGEIVKDEFGNDFIVTRNLTVTNRVDDIIEKEDGSLIAPSSGEIEMPIFSGFSYEEVKGRNLVVTETAYDYVTGEIFIEHNDLNDEGQTIRWASIGTQARDDKDGDNIISYDKTNKIIDRVDYDNLVPGEYTVVLTVMDKNEKEPLKSKYLKFDIKSTAKVEIEGESGSFEVEIEVPEDIAEGKELVIFEEIYKNGVIVAYHRDYNAASQTITCPGRPVTTPVEAPKTGDPYDGEVYLMILMAAAGLNLLINRACKWFRGVIN